MDSKHADRFDSGLVSLHSSVLFPQFQVLIYRVSHELRSLLRKSVPYVKIYRYNPKHLYPKLNGYGDNGKRSLKVWQLLHTDCQIHIETGRNMWFL